MDYSVNEAKSVLELLHEASLYAIPLIIALIFPLIWIMFKKLLGLNGIEETPTPLSVGTVGRLFSLRGDRTDRAVFYVSLSLFLIGLGYLKYGQGRTEAIRQKVMSLKQYYKIHEVISIPKTELLPYYQKSIKDITKEYPNDFLISYDNGVETVFCVDSVYMKYYSNKVYSLLSEYIDKKILEQGKVDVSNLHDSGNNLKNYFLKTFVYNYLAIPSSLAKYYLDAGVGNRVLLSYKTDTIIKIALDNIYYELKSRNWSYIGFDRLRQNIQTDYSNEFIRSVLERSGGHLRPTKLVDNGSHDTLGIQLVN